MTKYLVAVVLLFFVSCTPTHTMTPTQTPTKTLTPTPDKMCIAIMPSQYGWMMYMWINCNDHVYINRTPDFGHYLWENCNVYVDYPCPEHLTYTEYQATYYP